MLVVAGGELAGSGAVFSFAYSGEVSPQPVNHGSYPHSITMAVPGTALPCQLETEVGRHLRRDVMLFLSNNSTITNRVNRLQMEVDVQCIE